MEKVAFELSFRGKVKFGYSEKKDCGGDVEGEAEKSF